MNSTKEDYNKKFDLISYNLNKYSKDFLKKINLRYVVMCENLSISGINTAGIPDSIMKTLILDIKFNKKYFKRTIHHEVFHIINDSFKELFNEDEWVKFNNKNFKYADCSTCTKKLGLNTYTNTSGFFTEYSQSTPSEDMAETFSHIMTLSPKKLKEINLLLPEEHFFRIHNSFIINLNKIKEFLRSDGYVVLEDNHKIPVSRQRKSDFLEKF